MKKNNLFILSFFLINSAISQVDTLQYHQVCATIKKNNKSGKDVLDVTANKFLKPGQVYIYFHISKSDTLSIAINDSLVKKYYVNVQPDRTGDNPDYFIKLNTKSKKDTLTIYFEKGKCFFKIPIDKKYRIYGVVYKTGVWQECIYVEKKKYFRFS